jgi:hypothetical protein
MPRSIRKLELVRKEKLDRLLPGLKKDARLSSATATS